MKSPDVHIPQKVLAFYETLVASFPEVERKGKTMPYTSVNGHMFSFISKAGEIGIRLPKEEREEFIRKFKTRLLTSHGTVMKEYVRVPKKLLDDMSTVKKYFKISYLAVLKLKPK